jgi:hypothetical protein
LTSIKACSSVVNVAPGLYQIRTVLQESRNRSRMSKEENLRKHRERYHINKAKREQLLNQIPNLPDDESELWNRPIISIDIPIDIFPESVWLI